MPPERLHIKKSEIDLHKLFTESGLPAEELDTDWEEAARVYSDIIWELANFFPDKDSTEMTHIEHCLEPGEPHTIGLILCLDFLDANNEHQGPLGFMLYVKKHLNLIPEKLRKQFTLYVGFNYGDKGAFKLSGRNITPIPQSDYDNLPSLGTPRLSLDEAHIQFNRKLHQTLQAILEPTH